MTVKHFNDCIERISKGDKSGLADIYNVFYKGMTLAARNIVKNITAAEDIASEFIKDLLENSKNIPFVKNPAAYIFRAIKNRALNYIKREHKLRPLEHYENQIYSSYSQSDLKIDFDILFETFTQEEKEVYVFHFSFGAKYKEIAEAIGKSESMVKYIVSVIKSKLKPLKKYL